MAGVTRTFQRAIVSGTVASVTSSIVLGALARAEGKAALQPVNATSHWLNGEPAASFKKADFAHTSVGYATHHGATVFWAIFFERLIAAHRPVSVQRVLTSALTVSAVAAVVDYGATPKRFTPGWEFVLSKRSMGATYVAMAIGLAAGALLTQQRPARRSMHGKMVS